jgi:hypothetical protein
MLPEMCRSFGTTGFIKLFLVLPNLVFGLNVKTKQNKKTQCQKPPELGSHYYFG